MKMLQVMLSLSEICYQPFIVTMSCRVNGLKTIFSTRLPSISSSILCQIGEKIDLPMKSLFGVMVHEVKPSFRSGIVNLVSSISMAHEATLSIPVGDVILPQQHFFGLLLKARPVLPIIEDLDHDQNEEFQEELSSILSRQFPVMSSKFFKKSRFDNDGMNKFKLRQLFESKHKRLNGIAETTPLLHDGRYLFSFKTIHKYAMPAQKPATRYIDLHVAMGGSNKLSRYISGEQLMKDGIFKSKEGGSTEELAEEEAEEDDQQQQSEQETEQESEEEDQQQHQGSLSNSASPVRMTQLTPGRSPSRRGSNASIPSLFGVTPPIPGRSPSRRGSLQSPANSPSRKTPEPQADRRIASPNVSPSKQSERRGSNVSIPSLFGMTPPIPGRSPSRRGGNIQSPANSPSRKTPEPQADRRIASPNVSPSKQSERRGSNVSIPSLFGMTPPTHGRSPSRRDSMDSIQSPTYSPFRKTPEPQADRRIASPNISPSKQSERRPKAPHPSAVPVKKRASEEVAGPSNPKRTRKEAEAGPSKRIRIRKETVSVRGPKPEDARIYFDGRKASLGFVSDDGKYFEIGGSGETYERVVDNTVQALTLSEYTTLHTVSKAQISLFTNMWNQMVVNNLFDPSYISFKKTK